MPRRQALSCVLVPAFLALCCRGACGLDAGGEGRYILERMRERDARFENARLRYLLERTVTIDPFHAVKFRSAGEPVPGPSGPQSYRASYEQELIVRGADVTLISRAGPRKVEGSDDVIEPPALSVQKISSAGGITRHLSEHGEGPSKDRDIEIRKTTQPVDWLQERRMALGLSHGLGIAERITDIDSVTETHGGLVIEGSVQIWTEDESRFVIELDGDYVVRKAVIDSNVRGNLTRFEVSTEGSLEKDGLVLARRGTFKRIAQGRLEDGVRVGRPKVTDEFSTTYKDAEFNLSDDEYARLTRMEITPGTWVNDRIAGLRYRAGETGVLGPSKLDKESVLDVVALQTDETKPAEPPAAAVEPEPPSPQAPQPDSPDTAAPRPSRLRSYVVVGLLVLGAAAALSIRRRRKSRR